MRPRAAIALLATVLLATACGGGHKRVIVAVGTTLVDSGVMDRLAETYESSHSAIEVSVVGRATQEVLDLGDRGAADLLITHAPSLEQRFIEDHSGAVSTALFRSRFLLVGPEGRSAALDGTSIVEALRRIADRSWRFVTRADRSGTYERERELWRAAGVNPDRSAWYKETGQGMGFSLQVADQTGAFILVEQGTLLAGEEVLRLRPVRLNGGDELLVNLYTAIVPDGEDADGAGDFLEWLLSSPGREALAAANAELFGTDVFVPAAPARTGERQ